MKYCLNQWKWYRKWKKGTWLYVVAYHEFRYWINRKPLFNEKVYIKEVW